MDRAAAGRDSCAVARSTADGRTPTFAEQAALLLLDAAAAHDDAGCHVLADSFRRRAREIMHAVDAPTAAGIPPADP